MDLRNPETQLSILMVSFLAYLFSPAMFLLLLLDELDSGGFGPTDADSISIPMFGFLVLWFIGLVLISALTISFALSRRIVRNLRGIEMPLRITENEHV